MDALNSESDDGFILRHRHYGFKRVTYVPGAPKEPDRDTPGFLDHLDRYAKEVVLNHPEAPAIVREGDRFLLKRDKRDRKPTRYKTVRTALKKVLFELASKDEASK